MSTSPRLELELVSRTYPNGVAALRDVSLRIGAGLFGLLGPNGAGKSSLMRTIASLQAPDRGIVRFDGRDVFADVTAHRARLGYLPQDFGVYPGVSAIALLDHLAILKGLVSRGERRDQVHALLHQVNLWEVRHRAVSGYSGGMRQRFGIAQALLGAPELLIVDEPTAGLDPAERTRFYNLLSSVGESMVVMLSTHLVDDVRQLCPHMAIMFDGRVVCEGVPDDLVRALDGRVYMRTLSREEESRSLAWDIDAHPVRELTRARHAGRMTVRMLAEGVPDASSQRVNASLEDVYLRATGVA